MGHLKKLNQKTKNEPLLDMHPTEITLGKRKKETRYIGLLSQREHE
jgi:hypothetical protein